MPNKIVLPRNWDVIASLLEFMPNSVLAGSIVDHKLDYVPSWLAKESCHPYFVLSKIKHVRHKGIKLISPRVPAITVCNQKLY